MSMGDQGDESMSNGNMTMSPPSDMMMMHMSLYWGKDAMILFSGWPKDSLGMYILAFFCVVIFAAAVEVLSVCNTAKIKGTRNPLVGAFIQAWVYGVRMGFAYLVMLAVMSFNLGIFIAAVVGHAIGFFLVKVRALTNGNRANENEVPKSLII